MKMKCEHKNKENISSHQMPNKMNHVEVKCLDCGMMRYETRKNDGSITTSTWFIPKNKK